MDRSVINNRLINDIMSNSSPVTILLSSSDGDSIDFVSDLSNCYKNTFWVNAEYDNMYSFTIMLAQKVFNDDATMMRKLMQFKYCELEYNKENIILNVALQKISTFSGDCLLVMDNLELLHKGDINSLIELLIKNCPKNLKILLISETFLNLNYSLFEPNCPKLIDELMLTKDKLYDLSVIDQVALSKDDLAFLSYISQIRHCDRKFVYNIYPTGNEVLSMLSIKYKNLVFCKGSELYWINPELNTYLLERYQDLENYDFYSENINLRLCKHFVQENKIVKSIKIAICNKWYDLADEYLKKLISDPLRKFTLYDFGSNILPDIVRKHDFSKNFYCRYLHCLAEYYYCNFEVALKMVNTLILEAEPSSQALYDLYYIKIRCLSGTGHNQEAADLCFGVLKKEICEGDVSSIYKLQSLLGYLPQLFRNTNRVLDVNKLKKYEEMMSGDIYVDSYWYPKIIQAGAEAYFDLGYYNKAIAKVELLKEIFPFYVLPHKLIDYYYYSGDVNKYMRAAEICLENSKLYNIDGDLASVYGLMAKGSMYYEKYDKALEYMELAVTCENSSEQVKYYSIALRAIMHAKMGKIAYARDLATIYAKICELNHPKFTYYFYAVLAFCSWKNKDCEQTKYYANKCLQTASAKSGTWFLASAMSLSCIISRGEIRDSRTLLTKFLNSCKTFSMESIIIDYYDCFQIPLKNAKEEGIMLDYINEIELLLDAKKKAVYQENKIYIKFFGNTEISVNNEQIVWKTKKTKELFLLLVWAGETGIERKTIIDLLWKDYVYVSSLNNLKTTNNLIRNTLQSYNVPFKLEYVNSRYTLTLPNCESDCQAFYQIMKNYKEDIGPKERADQMRKALIYYDEGFATEITNEQFADIRKAMQSEMFIKLIKLIEDLISVGEYLEAKRFLIYLERISGAEEDYSKLQNEIDNNIRKRF